MTIMSRTSLIPVVHIPPATRRDQTDPMEFIIEETSPSSSDTDYALQLEQQRLQRQLEEAKAEAESLEQNDPNAPTFDSDRSAAGHLRLTA